MCPLLLNCVLGEMQLVIALIPDIILLGVKVYKGCGEFG